MFGISNEMIKKYYPIVLFLLIASFFIGTGSAAHSFDTSANDSTSSTWSTTNPITISYQAGTGATVMIVNIFTAGAIARTGTPTFNGKTFTQVGTTQYSGVEGYVEMWYLLLIGADTGIESSVLVPNSDSKNIRVHVSTYISSTGVSVFDVYAQKFANTGSDPSQTITTTGDGDVMIDALFDGSSSVPSANSHTLIYKDPGSAFSASSQYYLQETRGAQALSWTVEDNNYALITAAFKEAPIINITDQGNNVTNNNSLILSVNQSAIVSFNLTANITIDSNTTNIPSGVTSLGNSSLGTTTFWANFSFPEYGLKYVNLSVYNSTCLCRDDRNWTVTVNDVISPSVTSNTNNVYTANSSVIQLNATIADNTGGSGVKNATVNVSSLNSTINEAILTNEGGFWINNTIFADRGETNEFKNLTITAYDYESNVNNSINMTVRIIKPDLILTNANISFSFTASDIEVGEIKENNNVIINATIFNSGHLDVNNVNVCFYDGSTSSNIISNATIISINVSERKNVTVYWNSIIGTHNISIKVDPDNAIQETDETNNNAFRLINVSAFQKYYGNLSGYFDLMDQERNSIKNWSISVVDGNIFITNLTEMNFNNLQALGRNKTGGIAQGNFSRADELLNLTEGKKNSTGFANNNISQLFSLDGTTPRNTTTFTVYGRPIGNVPIINSTNVLNLESVENATFITGILWDTSKDNGDGEYGDDGEDLIFIADINASKVGFVSSPHDYEIAIPSTLGNGGIVYFNIEFTN